MTNEPEQTEQTDQPPAPASPAAGTAESPRPEGRREGGRFDGPPRDSRGDDRGDRGDRGDRRGGRGGGGGFRRRGCEFCIDKLQVLDYKDVPRLRRYIGDRGKMEPRRKVGTCAKHQRWVRQAVKRARYMALLPYTAEHIRQTGVATGGRR